jgi:hypothetical protein
MTKPLTRAEILALPPATDLPTLGRALGLSEPVVRERDRCGELEQLGIKVVQLGAQRKVITASLLEFLGIGDTADGASSEAQPQVAAGQRHPAASVHRLGGA